METLHHLTISYQIELKTLLNNECEAFVVCGHHDSSDKLGKTGIKLETPEYKVSVGLSTTPWRLDSRTERFMLSYWLLKLMVSRYADTIIAHKFRQYMGVTRHCLFFGYYE